MVYRVRTQVLVVYSLYSLDYVAGQRSIFMYMLVDFHRILLIIHALALSARYLLLEKSPYEHEYR